MNRHLISGITLSLLLCASALAGCAQPVESDERVSVAQQAVAADNDPSAIWTAINVDGATYQGSNHILLDSVEYWFALDAGVFSLTTDAPPTGLYMQPAVYNRFVGAYLHTDPEDEYFGCIEPTQGGIWQVVSTGTKVTLTDPN